MTESQKVHAAFTGMLVCVLLSSVALGVAYRRGRVPLGQYVVALEGDRNFKSTLLRQCSEQLGDAATQVGGVQDDAARLLANLMYAMDEHENPDPTRPSLSDARWEAEQRVQEWSRR